MCMIEAYDLAQVNKKFARITNPIAALYFAEIVEILKQVKLKNKFDPATGMFKLNRKFVSDETGIETAEQKNCDQMFVKLGLVVVDSTNPDKLAVDMRRYTQLLTDQLVDAENILSPAARKTRAEKQEAKTSGIIASHVQSYSEICDHQLSEDEAEAVNNLVSVYYSKGIVKRAQWEQIFKLIISCAKDSSAVVELINYIIATNYTSIPIAVDNFMKKFAGNATKTGKTQTACSGVSDIAF